MSFLSNFSIFKALNPFMPGSGSVSKFGLDPDPYQNDPDPQHCRVVLLTGEKIKNYSGDPGGDTTLP